MAEGNESQPSTSSSSIEWSQPCRPFEFSEILLATGNFSESLVIGHGGFGKVFKGNVINGSSVVVAAFKRLDSMSSQGASEFWAEVKMLSKLRHCHLVSLFGYCNHEKEMIIIYEYMPNGTPEDHLHKLGTPLSWFQRLKICIGTARGLDYLHTGTGIEFGVIHRDVKSSNILLQDNWAAKISDFGLSKIGVTNKPSTYVKTLVKGTFGYLDPNYFTTGRLTRKSDVYSFGVVLLEVLCRKRAVDRSLDEEQWGLVPFVQESIKQGSLKSIIDSGIRDQISQKCLKEFLRIAERCLHNNPKQRPAMAEVVVALDSVLTLQQKIDNSSGRTIYGRMLDIFPFPFHGENSANNESRLSSNSKDNKDSVVSVPSLNVFNFSDLEKITKHFSQDTLVDRDGYSEVFLGWVDKKTFAPSTKGVGITVAVKKYNEGLPEWEAVVASLGRLAHPNIISLLGYGDVNRCCRTTFMGNTPYDNDRGSPWTCVHALVARTSHTRWYQNLNIFLDQNFNAKLGYFGLAKFRPKILDFDDVEFDASKHDMDTSRYLDQRDQLTGQLTVKSDIYSFGVVLFETLTGQRAWEPKFGFTLVKWARPFLADREKIKDIIDQRLNQNYPLQGAFECVALAARCVATNHDDRPSSEEVLQSLERFFNKYWIKDMMTSMPT
ncbi:hypothetical protein Lser_V15G33431 [Lactuca serriola]